MIWLLIDNFCPVHYAQYMICTMFTNKFINGDHTRRSVGYALILSMTQLDSFNGVALYGNETASIVSEIAIILIEKLDPFATNI